MPVDDPLRLSRRGVSMLVVLVVVVLGAAGAPWALERLGGPLARPADAADRPLGEPPAVVPTGAHRFLRTVDGRPVRWDPCAPVHLVVDERRAVPRGEQMLAESVASVNAATGLRLVVDGPADLDEDGRPRVAGDGRAPVVVAWTDPRTDRELRGDVAGYAVSLPAPRTPWFVSGRVALDAPQLARILRGPNGYALARSVVLHELGHLVGLDHVDAEGELMQARGTDLTDWGPGDREGLAALGSGGCRDY